MRRLCPTPKVFLALVMLTLTAVASACGDSDPPVIEAVLATPPFVPPPLHRDPGHVVVRLEALEKQQEIAPGVNYTVWSFNSTVPGPLIRVRTGDTVEVRLRNNGTVAHNIDLHAVNGPGGGAEATTVNPGEEKSFEFQAKSAGLFTYHCAAGIVADHIANGMFGAILVEPAEGMELVDREFYVGQSDVYATGDTGEPGNQSLDANKLLAEDPSYVLFNGHTKSLIGENALEAKVGEKARIFFVDGGPNLISSFHVIGEVFDKVWEYGSLESPPLKGIQTVLVPPGGATVVQFTLDVPGDYKLVDHAISRVSKGAVGTLHVTGAANPGVFKAASSGAAASHDMGTATRAPAAATTSTPTAGNAGTPGAGDAVKITMTDNAFGPKEIAVAPASKVTFQLDNQGKVPHNMQIAGAGGSFDGKDVANSTPEIINPGKKATLSWTAPAAPGTYVFRCEVHPTDMTGAITVR